MARAEISLTKPLEGATLQVKCNLTKQFWLRLWLGKWLLVMAAHVLGAGIEFEE